MIMPKTILGKWSAGLNIFFLLAVIVSIVLVKVVNILKFGDRWWDVTVGVIAPIELIALIIGIAAVIKNKDRSGLVSLSIITGVAGILFVLLHSLFISD